MPIRAPHSCAQPGCPVLVPAGKARCPAHARRPWAHAMESRHARGYGKDHEAMRRRVLAEEPLCRGCAKELATVADHIIPLFRSGSSERENYQGLCARCSSRKTAHEGGRGREIA